MEERDKDNYEKLASDLIEDFQDNFLEITFTAHPGKLFKTYSFFLKNSFKS